MLNMSRHTLKVFFPGRGTASHVSNLSIVVSKCPCCCYGYACVRLCIFSHTHTRARARAHTRAHARTHAHTFLHPNGGHAPCAPHPTPDLRLISTAQGAYSPAAISRAQNYSSTQASTVLPGTRLLLDRESARVGKVPCLGAPIRSIIQSSPGSNPRSLACKSRTLPLSCDAPQDYNKATRLRPDFQQKVLRCTNEREWVGDALKVTEDHRLS